MKHQNPLTIIALIKPEKHDNLHVFLRQIKEELIAKKHEEFENIGTIHFARWFIMDDKNQFGNSEHQRPKLVFSSNFDGDTAQHIKDLCTISVNLIDKIYENCIDYPSAAERTTENRIKYFTERNVPASSFYRGAPDRSLKQIRGESQLRNFLRNVLDSRSWKNCSAKEIQTALQNAVNAKPELAWAKEPAQLPKVNWIGMFFVGIVLLLLAPFVILWVLFVQFFYERKDKYFTLLRSELDEKKTRELQSYEDLEHVNQFTQLVEMKPGKVRLYTFKALMLFSKFLIKFLFVEGKLMGIPTIHFARWVLFDNNKRVLFFSNFDGNWQQYLGDFIDKSGWGLTGIFSNTSNFPKTRFLFTGGAYDEEHFLAWSRNTELPTQVWYNAYPKLSIKNVNNNSMIRSLLFKNLSESKAEEFLQLI